MSFHFIKSHAKRTGAIIASIACAVGAQTLFLPMAHADDTTENVTVKQVNLGKKIAQDGIVETKESVVFAAPKSIKDADMRRAQIAWYKAGKSGGQLITKAGLNKLVSQYLSKKGYKNFNQNSPLQSELGSQGFIFSKPPADLKTSQAKEEKSKLLKTNREFASYLEKLCSEDKISSSPLPLTYSPTHPTAVAPLQAGGYLFYSADNAFLPQVVFTTGVKVKDLLQNNFVKLNPVSPKGTKKKGPDSKTPSEAIKKNARDPKTKA